MANEQNTPDIIGLYGRLLALRDRFAANPATDLAQRNLPTIERQIRQIEARAAAVLSPDQQQQALRMAQTYRSEVHQQHQQSEQQREEFRDQRHMARTLRSLTGNAVGGTGLRTPEEVVRASEGKPIKRKTDKVTFDKEAFERNAKERYGVDGDTLVERLDHLVELKTRGETERLERNMKAYKIGPEDVNEWGLNGIAYSMARRQAERDRDLPEVEEIEPTYSDTLRADIVGAMVPHTEEDGPLASFEERVDHAAYGNDLAADISAAMDQVQEREDRREEQEVLSGTR